MLNEERFYSCSGCGYDRLPWGVTKCPNCMVKIEQTTCKHCKYIGRAEEFVDFVCPKCGKLTGHTFEKPKPIIPPAPKPKTPSKPKRNPISIKTYCLILGIIAIISIILFIINFNLY